MAEQSNKEGWPAERFLSVVMEHELAERETRRLERHRIESQLLPGKMLLNFDFTSVPTVIAGSIRVAGFAAMMVVGGKVDMLLLTKKTGRACLF